MSEGWRATLELRRALREAGVYPDSDARFRQAARELPDAEWIEHFSFFYTYHGGELGAIEARALGLVERGDARVWVILGDVAAHRREWGKAVAAFEAGMAAGADCGARLARARMYARIEAGGWATGGEAYRVLAINLARATERMAELRVRFEGCALERIEAVDGTALGGARAGTLGCFMSHMAAWRLVAEGGMAALVLEDDVVPLLPLPGRLGALDLPAGWEVVWVNERMVQRLDTDARGFTAAPLAGVVQGFWPGTVAPGADAYLISPAGARRLLALVARDGTEEDVDWRMVAYGMTGAEVEAILQGVHAREAVRRAWRGEGGLRAYVLHPPLIRDVGLTSWREAADGAGP